MLRGPGSLWSGCDSLFNTATCGCDGLLNTTTCGCDGLFNSATCGCCEAQGLCGRGVMTSLTQPPMDVTASLTQPPVDAERPGFIVIGVWRPLKRSHLRMWRLFSAQTPVDVTAFFSTATCGCDGLFNTATCGCDGLFNTATCGCCEAQGHCGRGVTASFTQQHNQPPNLGGPGSLWQLDGPFTGGTRPPWLWSLMRKQCTFVIATVCVSECEPAENWAHSIHVQG